LLDSNIENEHNEFVRSSLAGFTNQFKEKSLPIETKFLVHREVGSDYDFLTGSGNFFEPKDFDLSDIVIDGAFDGKGFFKGKLKIYDKVIQHSYTSSRKKDIRSDYGSFNIKLGYLMGNESESKLSDTAYDKLKDKINRFGALYIYRDGFRVLPYGRTDYDFLEFEKKRSKRASTAFFSHRRMLGYIEITRKENENLKDKAGREGLINNASYRAFKDDLQSFFDDLAKEYFSDEARKSIFLDKKKDLKSQSEEIKKDKEREKQEKSSFTRSLKEYPAKFDEYQKNYKSILSELDNKTKDSNVIYSEIEDLLEQINKFDIAYKDLLPSIPRIGKFNL
ncbi:MAG: hypothetical protein HYZ42_13650, partial [Bacteroidetes bacterium]|nr:hypothetical protein [Bacteroidota bacterium]